MPITREQFDRLVTAGLTPDQIRERVARMEATQGEIRQFTPERRIKAAIVKGLATLPGAFQVAGALTTAAPTAVATRNPLVAARAGVPGAALGRTVGRGIERLGQMALGYRPYENLGEEVADIAWQPGIAAAEQYAGNILAAPLNPLAERLMEKGLATSRLVEGTAGPKRALRKLAKLAVTERVRPGGTKMETGAEQVIHKAQISGAELTRLLDEAHQAGVSFRPTDLTNEVTNLLDEITYQPLATGDRRAVESMLSEFQRDHPGPLSPMDVKLLKRRAQEIALPIIKRRQVRPGVNAAEAIRGRFNDAIARGTRQALEQIKTPIPGTAASRTFGQAIAEREATTSDLLRLAEQMRRAEGATSKVSLHPLGPFRPVGTATPFLTMTRPQAGRIALAMTDPAIRQIVTQSPALGDLILRQLLYQEPEEVPR